VSQMPKFSLKGANHFNIDIRVYEPNENSEGTSWMLVYGQN